jgi:hypothetical protein
VLTNQAAVPTTDFLGFVETVVVEPLDGAGGVRALGDGGGCGGTAVAVAHYFCGRWHAGLVSCPGWGADGVGARGWGTLSEERAQGRC